MEKTRSILVVDDEIYIREIMRNILEDEGFRVTTADNGQEAIDIYQESNAELIILDIKMPGMDGYKMLELLRKESDVPVIVLTCVQEKAALVRIIDLGADDYVVKPFNQNELMARVRSLIRRVNYTKDL